MVICSADPHVILPSLIGANGYSLYQRVLTLMFLPVFIAVAVFLLVLFCCLFSSLFVYIVCDSKLGV